MNIQPSAANNNSIEQKIANILKHTQAYAAAAVKKDTDSVVNSILQFAQQFAEHGNMESARDQIKKAYRLYPGHPAIAEVEEKIFGSYTIKEAAHKQETLPAKKQNDEAEIIRKLGFTHLPYEIQILLAKAELFRLENNFERAKQMIAHAYERDPLNEYVQAMEEKILQTEQNETASVEIMLRRAERAFVERNPSIALSIIAQCYEQDPLNENIHILENAIHEQLYQNKEMQELLIENVKNYIRIGEIQKAKFELQIAFSIDPLNKTVVELTKTLR